ncbi:MAG: nicotinate phosphoribosyltransferase [Opitutaceae bacterium]|jgi:nicotinate phosphoribosyltransferase|nr:nicotinate phosphoribosyltransferase [Opitutaceae bacterium]
MKFDLSFTDAPVTAFLDFYKWTMLQAMAHQLNHSGGVRLRYRHSVRTKNAGTARVKDALREALDAFEDRHALPPDELRHARAIRFLKPVYVNDTLRDLRLHPKDMVRVGEKDGEVTVEVEGGIASSLLETLVLATVSELMTQLSFPTGAERRAASDRGLDFLAGEIKKLKAAVAAGPGKVFRLTEAGTRRRFTLAHHRRVMELIRNEMPGQLFGTSNIHFAFDMDLRPVGTQAHEFGMLFQQHGGTLKTFVSRSLQAWVEEYRGDLGYALPDVLTTKAFLESFDLYFAKLFDGVRHDSGDPHEWTRLVVSHFEKLGIDPASKFAVYSDGLDFDAALDLWRRYEGKPWKTSYLIGTFLSNNIPGHKALGHVMKLVAVNDQPVAKISDEPEKAICDSPEFLASLKQTFGIA